VLHPGYGLPRRGKDTGMSCRNIGGASICEPPQGTVHYQNRHGLNCTRTGIVSFCSNL